MDGEAEDVFGETGAGVVTEGGAVGVGGGTGFGLSTAYFASSHFCDFFCPCIIFFWFSSLRTLQCIKLQCIVIAGGEDILANY